jgi:2-alkenal reductase
VKHHHAPGWIPGFVSGLAAFALIAALAVALLAPVNLGLSGASAQDDEDETPTASNAEEQAPAAMDAVDVVQRVSPAVVTVINRQTGILGEEQTDPQEGGVGTGFIIDDEGHIVTNQHVVEGGDEFVILLADGEQRDADLVGADAISDLAVLLMDGDIPATVPFGDSDSLLPGETVIAIGSPLGAFTTTVTQGIVSALGRDFSGLGGDPGQYTNLIQHDAAINPGNSGGPLFNMDGEVVGVNTLGITETGGSAVAQGLFFAVPSSTVQEIVTEIIETGEVLYPFFGIGSQPVTPQLASEFDLEAEYGVVVVTVSADSGAADAGIEPGDIVLEIEGQPIDRDNPFVEVLFGYDPGDTVEVLIQRGDDQITLDVTLSESEPDDE